MPSTRATTNLFLAITTVAGIVGFAAGSHVVGLTLVIVGTASMLGAALVLASASAAHRSAALRQGLFPALAVIASAIHLLT